MSSCWCGNANLAPFSDDYLRCEACETLVAARMPDPESLRVKDDVHDFYGAQYYERLLPALGYAPLPERARSDLTDRCVHWLRYLLRHKLPPGKVLEPGCAHGGFVALLRAAGFDATGLELSPSLCDYARRTFDVPVLTGPVEAQDISSSSLDAVVLMDVLEHLHDPFRTMAYTIELLQPDGLLLLQTPRYREGKTLERMLAEGDRFVEHLKPEQHLYLFSETSMRLFLERLAVPHIVFEPAVFAHYDMFVAAGRQPLQSFSESEVHARLQAQPSSRLALALLDLDAQRREIEERLVESEADRAARLTVIREVDSRYRESEADRAARLELIERLQSRIREMDANFQKLEAHSRQAESRLGDLESAHATLRERSAMLERELASAQARGLELEQRAASLNAQCVGQRQVIEHQTNLLNRMRASHVYRSMRRLKLWGWLDAPAESEELPRPVASQPKELRRVAVDLTPVLPGGENGGAKVVIVELIRHLSKLAPQCEFVLLTHERTHEELAALDTGNVRRVCAITAAAGGAEKAAVQSRAVLAKVLPASVLDKASSAYRSVAGGKSGALLREIGADLLFCPFTAPFFFEPGTPAVSLVHDLQCITYPQFFSSADREERIQHFHRACRLATKIVCVSEFVRGTVLANSSVSPDRVAAIHTRTAARLVRTPESKRAEVLARLGLVAGKFLLYPANFWAHKNHEMLITAMGMYAAKYPHSELKLVLTGAPGTRRDELMAAARDMELAPRVIFPGFVPEEELGALMDGCLAVIFPSLFEGFGLPILEAMAADKPVLASNVTSLPEVGGDAVLFFDPRRPTEMVSAIARIEHDAELRETLRDKGRNRLAYFGGPERMAQEYLRVFREVVSGPAVIDPGIYGVYHDGWAGEHITIAYAGNGGPQQLNLEVSLPAWAPMQALSLTFQPGGAGSTQSHRVRRGEAVTISRPLGGGPGTIELHCSPTFQPKECAISDDTRTLSCHVLRADIASADGHTTDLKAMSHAV